MQRQVGLDEPGLGPLLDGREHIPLADGVVALADLLAHVGGHQCGDLQELVAVRTQQALRTRVVAVVLNQPHHLLCPRRACRMKSKPEQYKRL